MTDGMIRGWRPLAVALALALRNRGSLPDKPQDTVSEFFTAAGEGDDRAYLRLVTGELRKSLENDRSQAGAEAFRDSLRRSAAGIGDPGRTRQSARSMQAAP